MATWPAKTNYATGDVLTAAEMQDIGNALNSLESAQYAAGKNKIINGDFAINQRGFSSTTATNTFGFDRFNMSLVGDGTTTWTAQTFTAGTAPVAGYEAINYSQIQTTGQTATNCLSSLSQKIESVRTFAGQTITVSFWAKASSGTPNITAFVFQSFGSGGSSSVFTGSTKKAISTSWARYSFVINVPSVSGKTIGAGDFLRVDACVSAGSDRNAYTDSIGIQTGTFQIWGVQAEAGNTATAFQTATGTLAGELSLCQRYYERFGQAANVIIYNGTCYNTVDVYGMLPFLVQKRTTPTVSITNAGNFQVVIAGSSKVPSSAAAAYISNKAARMQFTTTGLTAGQAAWVETDGGSNGFIEVSAEL